MTLATQSSRRQLPAKGRRVWALVRKEAYQMVRDPSSIVGQFALGRAYVMTGDFTRAQVALVQTRRLLAPLAADAFVPGDHATTYGGQHDHDCARFQRFRPYLPEHAQWNGSQRR